MSPGAGTPVAAARTAERLPEDAAPSRVGNPSCVENEAAASRLDRLAAVGRLGLAGVQRGLRVADPPTAWRLSALAGRFAEVSGSQATASLTFAFRLVFEAQTLGEPAAWIGVRGPGGPSAFYPPDVAAVGIDLSALPVVRAGDAIRAARVADHLLRSGAFGLLVLDLGPGGLPIPVQTRLNGLAKKHDAALLCLTEKDAERPSLGSLVSLRAQALKHKAGDRYRCEVRVLKDKRRGPGFKQVELCHGPDGLC